MCSSQTGVKKPTLEGVETVTIFSAGPPIESTETPIVPKGPNRPFGWALDSLSLQGSATRLSGANAIS